MKTKPSSDMNRPSTTHIVIAGSGYAGLAAARALSHLQGLGISITLVDRNDYATAMPLLPDVAALKIPAKAAIAPIKSLLPKGVSFIRSHIENYDFSNSRVHLEEGAPLDYTWLIAATGSRTALRPPLLPNAAGGLFCLDSLDQAKSLSSELLSHLRKSSSTGKKAHIVIYGGGYTAVETIANLEYMASSRGFDASFSIVCRSSLLRNHDHWIRQRLAKYLKSRNIQIVEDTQISSFRDGEIACEDRNLTLVCDKLILAAGVEASVRPTDLSGAQWLPDGRMVVEPTLMAKGLSNVMAVGDAAAIPIKGQRDQYLRRSVNFAIFSGTAAGRNLSRILQGRQPLPFNPPDPGWILPAHGDSAGKLFNRIPVWGSTGLRLHYLMCGIRNFSLSNLMHLGTRALTLFPEKVEF